jgi:hypothetical protein
MIFTKLAILLVGAAGYVQANAAEGYAVTKRTIRPNPSNGHWVDAWASMPQLTEPANLPPAPFVRQFLNARVVLTVFRTKLVPCL